MLVALHRRFELKTNLKKFTHKEFSFLISCWKMLADTSGGSRRRVEPSGPDERSKSRHAHADTVAVVMDQLVNHDL